MKPIDTKTKYVNIGAKLTRRGGVLCTGDLGVLSASVNELKFNRFCFVTATITIRHTFTCLIHIQNSPFPLKSSIKMAFRGA